MSWTPFNSFLGLPIQTYLGNASPPSSSGFYLILLNGGTIDATSTISTILAQEVAASNGYARQNYNPAAGSYNATTGRYEEGLVTLTFTATTGGIVFDRVVMLAATNGIQGTTGTPMYFQAQASATTIPAGTSYSFQASFNMGNSSANVN